MKNRILIISPHDDDESFGMGGTLLKLKENKDNELYWLIITKSWEPRWSGEAVASRERAIEIINKEVGFSNLYRWNFPNFKLDNYDKNDLHRKMVKFFDELMPNEIYLPSPWDVNFEHQLVFEIVKMSSKPFYSKYIKAIIAYEVPSSTDAVFSTVSKFTSNLYVDISKYIERKIHLIEQYKSENYAYPHPRSAAYVKALAQVRGGESGLEYAESFHILRKINK